MDGTLYLIRHGATEGSDGEPRYKGSLDVPLSDEGRSQVRLAAEFMLAQGMQPSALYCSPLSRARISARIIGDVHGLEPESVDEFRERDFGRWEGMSYNEIGQEFPDAFESWANDPLTFSPIDGESTLQVRDRIMPRLKELLDGLEQNSLAIVAHGGVNRVILCELLRLPLEHIFRIEQHHACLNVIRFYDGLPVGELINLSLWGKPLGAYGTR